MHWLCSTLQAIMTWALLCSVVIIHPPVFHIETIEKEFARLTVKEKPIQVAALTELKQMDELKSHLTKLFPDMDLTNLTKLYTNRCKTYQTWLERHCRQRQYVFQIRKCDDHVCCAPKRCVDESLSWLPDPKLDDTNPGHYLKFEKVYRTETDESDRSTLLTKKNLQTVTLGQGKKAAVSKVVAKSVTPTPSTSGTKTSKLAAAARLFQAASREGSNVLMYDEAMYGESSIFTAQNAQAVTECVKCWNPRILYSKSKLTETESAAGPGPFWTRLHMWIAPTSSSHGLHGKVYMRLNINCENPIEIPYFSTDIGRHDLCCYCATDSISVDQELKKQFKTVLPVCEASLLKDGIAVPCFRPFGKW